MPAQSHRCVWHWQNYWTLPFANGWLHMKGHVAYGMTTDQNWQHDFTAKQSKYTDRALFHSKAGYLKVGNDEVFCPWSLEMGLEMVSIFGGTSYLPDGHGAMRTIREWQRAARLLERITQLPNWSPCTF